MMLPATVALLLGMAAFSQAQNDSSACLRVQPGLDRMAKGVDLTKLDLYHDFGPSGEDGFVRRVIDFHCNSKKKATIDKETYDVPDEFEDADPVSAGSSFSTSNIMKTKEELKHMLSVEVGLQGSYGGTGSFSLSPSYARTSESMESQERETLITKVTVLTEKAQLDPINILKSSVSKSLMEQVAQLPDKFDESTVKAYMDLFREYGTHFFSQANLGGVVSSITEIDKKLKNEMEEKTMKLASELKLEAVVGIKANVEKLDKITKEKFNSYTVTTNQYNGGFADLLNDKKPFSDWTKAVPLNPWIFSGKLVPITELLPADNPKTNEIKKAYFVYMEKAHLDEILSSTKTYLSLPVFKDNVSLKNIIQKVEDAQKQAIPDPKISKELGDQLYDYVKTPEWFKKSFICNWVPDIWNTGPGTKACTQVGKQLEHASQAYQVCRYQGSEVKCFDMKPFFRASTPEGQAVLDKYATIKSQHNGYSYGPMADTKELYKAMVQVDVSPDSFAPGWLRRIQVGSAFANEADDKVRNRGTVGVNTWTPNVETGVVVSGPFSPSPEYSFKYRVGLYVLPGEAQA